MRLPVPIDIVDKYTVCKLDSRNLFMVRTNMHIPAQHKAYTVQPKYSR